MQLLMCCGWLPGCCCLVVFYSVGGGCHGVAVWLVMRRVWMPRCCYAIANVLWVVAKVLLFGSFL